jgi:hypothetical protein
MSAAEAPIAGNPSDLVPFDSWIKSLGRTRATGHRWRKKFSWLEAGIVNIFGKNYISRAVIAEFERRAAAGEFSRDVHPPNGRRDVH